MSDRAGTRPDLLALIRELSDVGPDGILPVALKALAQDDEDAGIRFLLADVEERVLNVWDRIGHDHHPNVGSVRMEGSEHGRVYRTGEVVRTTIGGHDVLLAPVTVRRERIGVLEFSWEGPSSKHVDRTVEALGLLIGYIVTAADQWTDAFHVARRRKEMTLAAEIQWDLLPLAAFATNRVSLAGALEPAYDVGGDAFDYACGRAHLTAGIFDAMGHGLAASHVSALTVAAFRNARRGGKVLVEQARFVDRSIGELEGWDGFVTAQLVSIDLDEPSRSTIVNAGHPRPFIQGGSEAPRSLDLRPNRPLGVGLADELVLEPLKLKPGDRLTLLTDGTFEARPDGGEPFGDQRLVAKLEEYRSLPAREAARLVIASIRDHRAADLADDATLMMIDLPS